MSRGASTALLAVLALGLVLGACGDSSPPPSVEFGEGELPGTFPDAFPIPADARIGSTMIDRINHRSEVSMTVPGDLEAVVRFFNLSLVNQGYLVTRSEGDAAGWEIEFVLGELRGSVLVSAQTGGTQAVASVNRS